MAGVLTALAGCGHSASDDADAGADASPQRPGAHAAQLCAALDPAQVAGLVGAHPTPQAYGTDDGSAAGCRLSGTDGRTLTVNVAYGPREQGSVATLFDTNRATLEHAGHAIETEPGLADAAFWQPDPGVLHARTGDCYFTAHSGPGGADRRAALHALITAALAAVCPAEPSP